MPDRHIITVSQLNNYVKALLDSQRNIPGVYVRGEISNYRPHPSGHMYFTLKDQDASVSAVMFRSDASRLRFEVKNGMSVLCLGRIGLFVKTGAYQLYVNELHPDGIGDLFAAFEAQKERLSREGLFDEAHKKPIPSFPKRIGLVTAPSGAAVRDMIRILSARWPFAEITVMPVLVQGPDAGADIASAIDKANELARWDVLIVGRGGGSAEDLWAFNEECVARAIYRSGIPVISGVGHEPDVTIADYVADLRAATPSNAAELCVPDRGELSLRLEDIKNALLSAQRHILSVRRGRLETCESARVLQSPMIYVHERRQVLDHLRLRLGDRTGLILSHYRRRLSETAATLHAVSPLAVLSRGYAIASDQEGRVLRDSSVLSPGDRISIRFEKGRAEARITEVQEKIENE